MGRWVLLVAALLPTGAGAQAWAGTGSAEYVVVHKFHEVVGRCKRVEGRAVSDDGGLKVMARAEVACFDSGNTNRDTNAMETVDAAHHPLVIVKGVASGAKLPAPGQQAKVPVEARVELKGVERPQRIEVLFDRKDETTLEASFAFPVSLTAFGIERPSLLLVPVEDEVQIRGKLALKVQP
jgi:polyisoprenoid-binding protein YceI